MKTIIFQEKSAGSALTRQKTIDQSNFPFTLNTTIGCHFGCLYCYLQGFPFVRHTEFGKEVKVKMWLPKKLDLELEKYRDLPQYLKRVQVNAATEGYIPNVMTMLKNRYNRDIMKEVLKVFKKHWDNGNFWMVHLVTKSHMILKHLDILTEMCNQVQVELTITTLSEARRKLLEGSAPSVKKRLEVIRRLSGAGIFMRVMCMPFIGSRDEAVKLRSACFDCGARAFKHKSMNYWNEEALLLGNLEKNKGKINFSYTDLLTKSGEQVIENGRGKMKTVNMPTKKWDNWEFKSMMFENSGYVEMNGIDWGYVA